MVVLKKCIFILKKWIWKNIWKSKGCWVVLKVFFLVKFFLMGNLKSFWGDKLNKY